MLDTRGRPRPQETPKRHVAVVAHANPRGLMQPLAQRVVIELGRDVVHVDPAVSPTSEVDSDGRCGPWPSAHVHEGIGHDYPVCRRPRHEDQCDIARYLQSLASPEPSIPGDKVVLADGYVWRNLDGLSRSQESVVDPHFDIGRPAFVAADSSGSEQHQHEFSSHDLSPKVHPLSISRAETLAQGKKRTFYFFVIVGCHGPWRTSKEQPVPFPPHLPQRLSFH